MVITKKTGAGFLRKTCLYCRKFYRKYCKLLALAVLLVLCAGAALSPRPPPAHHMEELLLARSLHHYIDDILTPITEPLYLSCGAVVVLVSSSPRALQQRAAARGAWAQRLPTFFFVGLDQEDFVDYLHKNQEESNTYKDMVILHLPESRGNQTFKVALMMHWCLRRCPEARFVMKAEDDVLVNPWTLERVLEEHADSDLIGFKVSDGRGDRPPSYPSHLPDWLDGMKITEYLMDGAYIIGGKHLPAIYNESFRVPVAQLESVFFTYLVGKVRLSLNLTHDRRMGQNRPMFATPCVLWQFATVRGLAPKSVAKVWPRLQAMADEGAACGGIYKVLASDWFMWR